MNYFKNRAIKLMMKALPSILSKDYGSGDKFTIGQVCTACKKISIKDKYVHFAVVLFTDIQDEPEIFESTFPGITYQEARRYLAEIIFNGNVDFDLKKSRYSKTGNSGRDSMAGGTHPE